MAGSIDLESNDFSPNFRACLAAVPSDNTRRKPLPASDRPTFLSSMLDLGSLSNSPGRGSRPKWVHAETMPTNIEFDAFLSIDSRHGLLKSALLKRD